MLLSTLLFVPLLAALLVAVLPESQKLVFRSISIGVGVFNVLLSLRLFQLFNKQTPDYQFVEHHDWITLRLGRFGGVSIDYLLGLDGISLPLVLLASVVLLVGAVASWHIKQNPKGYHALYLLLSASIYGCFVSLDFFLFFLFFEFMLLPMYFLIGIWGGAKREYAALKFFIYTLIGSVLILIVMIALSMSVVDEAGFHTFDFRYLGNSQYYLVDSFLANTTVIMGLSVRAWAFWLLVIGFAIKLPVVPFHTWLPDAHVEAPTPVSVVLAGILLKVGGYGLIRTAYAFFLPEAQIYAYPIGLLATVSILYAAFNALAQQDLKRMIAYSSVSHMGFALLGIAALNQEGLNGAIFQMVSHGILSAMLFLIAGVLYDRTHDRRIENYRGLASKMPSFAIVTAIAFFASLGLPAFSGFIGEFFSLMGAFQSAYLPKAFSFIAVFGIVLSAAYFLWTFRRIFFGKFWANHNVEHALTDLNLRERFLLFSLAILSLLLGLFPQIVFDICQQTISYLF